MGDAELDWDGSLLRDFVLPRVLPIDRDVLINVYTR